MSKMHKLPMLCSLTLPRWSSERSARADVKDAQAPHALLADTAEVVKREVGEG
jgi:hypothetical protein